MATEETQTKIPLSKETIDMLNEQGPGDKPESYDSIIQRLCKEAGEKKSKSSSGSGSESKKEDNTGKGKK